MARSKGAKAAATGRAAYGREQPFQKLRHPPSGATSPRAVPGLKDGLSLRRLAIAAAFASIRRCQDTIIPPECLRGWCFKLGASTVLAAAERPLRLLFAEEPRLRPETIALFKGWDSHDYGLVSYLDEGTRPAELWAYSYSIYVFEAPHQMALLRRFRADSA